MKIWDSVYICHWIPVWKIWMVPKVSQLVPRVRNPVHTHGSSHFLTCKLLSQRHFLVQKSSWDCDSNNFFLWKNRKRKIICSIQASSEIKTKKTSNDIIAGNGRVLQFYLFIVWLYLLKKIYICTLSSFCSNIDSKSSNNTYLTNLLQNWTLGKP